jgi:GT2 family glycosyltransferase
VLRQSFADLEIIVSDNASTEDIAGVITESGDSRIRFYQQRQNQGAARNFHFLQTLAQGKYVLFLCSDDLLLPDCLKKAVRVLDQNPTRGGVVFMAAHYGDNGFRFVSTMPMIEYADADVYRENREVREFNFCHPSFCLYRRATFKRLGGWDKDLLALIDWEMYSRMINKGGGVCYLREVLGILRMHNNRHTDTDAVHGDFYHDFLILSKRPEHQGGTFLWLGHLFKARAVMEQLLWDLRLKRRPRATLQHAWRYGAMKSFVMLLPYEIMRRILIKIAIVVRWRKRADVPSNTLPLIQPFNREATDAFWKHITQRHSDRITHAT